MATIILRQSNVVTSVGATVKGSPLTNAELDNNFSNINVVINTLVANDGPVTSLTTNFKGNLVYALNELRSNLTTSAGLATLVTDETGTGVVVYNTSPTLAGTPQAVTAANATSNAMIATTQFVNNQILNSPNIQLPTINNPLLGYTSTVTAAGTTTLTAQSTYYQIFTGSSNQTIVLPVTSTCAIGQSYHIENNGSGTLTVQSSGLNSIVTVLPFTTVMVTCISTTGTDNTVWDYDYHAFGGVSGSSGNIILSGSPTLTGSPQSVTASNTTSNSMIATTQFVNNQITNSPVINLPQLVYPTVLNPTLVNAFERANIRNEAPPAILNIDLLDTLGSVVYFTSNVTANVAINFRGNVTTSLDSWLGSTTSNANVATSVIMITTGATPSYVNNVLIDGRIMHNNTVRGNLFWQGNTLTIGGTAAAIDTYSFTIIKNGGSKGGATYGGNVYTILAGYGSFKSFLS